MEGQPFATIQKCKIEELRIALRKYKGHRYVDVRAFVVPYEGEGQDRVHTRKGIIYPLPNTRELKIAVSMPWATKRLMMTTKQTAEKSLI